MKRLTEQIVSSESVPRSAARESARCACFNIRKAARAVTQLYDATLEPSGLRATQFALLMVLHGMGAATMTRLSSEMVMDRTTLTRNLRPLEKRGLVEATVGADRRTREIRLTTAGREALATALPLWRRAQAGVVGGLGKSHWDRLLPALAAVAAAARDSSNSFAK